MAGVDEGSKFVDINEQIPAMGLSASEGGVAHGGMNEVSEGIVRQVQMEVPGSKWPGEGDIDKTPFGDDDPGDNDIREPGTRPERDEDEEGTEDEVVGPADEDDEDGYRL